MYLCNQSSNVVNSGCDQLSYYVGWAL